MSGKACLILSVAIILGGPSVVRGDTVYSNDFEGEVGAEWSDRATDVTPVGARRFLGQFGNQTVTLTLSNLPSHGEVRLSFDLFILLSWDGDSAPVPPGYGRGPGPDIWSLDVSRGPRLIRTTFDNRTVFPGGPFYRQSYPGEYPSVGYPPQTGSSESNTLGYRFTSYPDVINLECDSVYRQDFTFPHSGSAISLDFAAFGLQELTDESWGLDNVAVEVSRESERGLVVSSTDHGSAVVPGEGLFWYPTGSVVSIEAVPADANSSFVAWVGSAVVAHKVSDPYSTNTQVLVDGAYEVKAVFRGPFNIPDANLKVAVEQTLGKADPAQTDMLALEQLDAPRRRIADLTGLEYATNLTWLRVAFNEVNDVSLLAGLRNLVHADIGPNRITDIGPLAGLINLTDLYLGSNPIEDISVLSGLVNLSVLRVENNEISDISPLAGLVNLRVLRLPFNHISDLSPLSGLAQLTTMSLNGNQIQDINALTGMTLLDIKGNPLSAAVYEVQIPQVLANNPGIDLRYDPREAPR
jgi:hypothetical protein